jgi:hypothetical protein
MICICIKEIYIQVTFVVGYNFTNLHVNTSVNRLQFGHIKNVKKKQVAQSSSMHTMDKKIEC